MRWERDGQPRGAAALEPPCQRSESGPKQALTSLGSSTSKAVGDEGLPPGCPETAAEAGQLEAAAQDASTGGAPCWSGLSPRLRPQEGSRAARFASWLHEAGACVLQALLPTPGERHWAPSLSSRDAGAVGRWPCARKLRAPHTCHPLSPPCDFAVRRQDFLAMRGIFLRATHAHAHAPAAADKEGGESRHHGGHSHATAGQQPSPDFVQVGVGGSCCGKHSYIYIHI